jgi:hypothetical protein
MWIHKNKPVDSLEDMPKGAIGFIYEITHIPSDKKYIGKKILHHNKKLPPLKGKKRARRVIKESDWKTYYGSNDEIKSMIKEGKQSEFTRKILIFATSKKQLSYLEAKEQFKRGVLERDDYFNTNILGRFYSKDV